jgi:hypothetical protein
MNLRLVDVQYRETNSALHVIAESEQLLDLAKMIRSEIEQRVWQVLNVEDVLLPEKKQIFEPTIGGTEPS